MVPENPLEIVDGKGIGLITHIVLGDNKKVVSVEGIIRVLFDVGGEKKIALLDLVGGMEELYDLLDDHKSAFGIIFCVFQVFEQLIELTVFLTRTCLIVGIRMKAA
jgi:hypothetical protein